jgi:sugar fermentation stimulation protein A
LIEAVSGGENGAIVFVIQRPDARCFAPHNEADPAFGGVLREAAGAGIGVYAWACEVDRREIALAGRVPVELT